MEKKRLYIDGEWVEGSGGKTFVSINPATGEPLAEICEASVEDAKRAITAAKKSFYETREWRDMDSHCYNKNEINYPEKYLTQIFYCVILSKNAAEDSRCRKA